MDEKSNAEKISDSYDRFYLNEGYQLAHYFRFLYNILRFLSEHEMDNKDLYAKLIRAQISNQELYLIYYNSFTERGKNFKKYMIEFQLMDNLPPSELATDEHAYLIPNVGFKFPKIK
ncbi:hypothetical protein AZ013_004387 [Citrobacter freundii]|nr:hypothetical protein AZ013_004387 [Citrobacter freundii]